MAVQMPNLGILESWNVGIAESWNLWITRDLGSLGLGTITGILTGISEFLDQGSLSLILEFVDLGIITGISRSWNRKSGVLESADLRGIAGILLF